MPDPILPPQNVPLEIDELLFFESVLAEFDRERWTPHQLEMAALLARAMAGLASEQRALLDEGSVCDGASGSKIANPRKSVIQMHAGIVRQLRQALTPEPQPPSPVEAKKAAAPQRIPKRDLIPRRN